MKKLALILGLTLSLSAHAWEPFAEDDLLVVTGDNGTTQYMTFTEVEAFIEEQDPILMEWCRQKAAVGAAVLADREIRTHDKVIEELRAIENKMRHYMWLEIERMTADIYRYKQKGGWAIPGDEESIANLETKEYQKCVGTGF